MPKRSSKPDENEMAFDALNELLRRDEARDKGENYSQKGNASTEQSAPRKDKKKQKAGHSPK